MMHCMNHIRAKAVAAFVHMQPVCKLQGSFACPTTSASCANAKKSAGMYHAFFASILSWLKSPFMQGFMSLDIACRINRGISYRKSKLPKKPVDLWAYEASPFCKLAREVICRIHLWMANMCLRCLWVTMWNCGHDISAHALVSFSLHIIGHIMHDE